MSRYEIGAYLMHEGSGVCQVQGIEERALSGKGSERLYYLLEPVFSRGSQIVTPVEGARQRLRDVMPPSRVDEILAQIAGLDILEAPNERILGDCYREAMAAFEPLELARIVKTVFVRRRLRIEAGKRIMSQDEKALTLAGKRLYEEMAFSTERTVEEMQAMVAERLADV